MRTLSKIFVPLIAAFVIVGMLASCTKNVTDAWSDLASSYQLTVEVVNETASPTDADIVLMKNGEVVSTDSGTSTTFTLDSVDPYEVKATKEFTTGDSETQTRFVMLSKNLTYTFTFVTGDIEANLQAHYPFDGDMAEETGAYSAGTVTGDRIDNTGGTITYASGQVGQAAVFDGASGVRLPDGLIDDYDYSVAFWLNPAALTQYTTTFFSAIDPDAWISVVPVCWNDSTMVWSNDNGNWFDGFTGIRIAADEWVHVAVIVNEGTIKVFIDGTEVHSSASFRDVFTGATTLSALAVNYWDTPFEGMIDDLYIYSAAIGAKTIANLMAEAD